MRRLRRSLCRDENEWACLQDGQRVMPEGVSCVAWVLPSQSGPSDAVAAPQQGMRPDRNS